MKLRIHYRSGADEVTDRVITDIIVEPPGMLQAFCQLRSEQRSFALNRIEYAIDMETNEVISNIWLFLGLPSQQFQSIGMPLFSERVTAMSTKEAHRQRTADKQALFRRFKHTAIESAFKVKLWALFDFRCFRCKAPGALELDHHIPQYLGGRLVAGNIVLLCQKCNSWKQEKHPRMIYSPHELAQLEGIFTAELALFDFRFNWSQWGERPREYLLSLGVPAEDIQQVLNDKERSEQITCFRLPNTKN